MAAADPGARAVPRRVRPRHRDLAARRLTPRTLTRRELNRAILERQLLLRRERVPGDRGGRAAGRDAGAGADRPVHGALVAHRRLRPARAFGRPRRSDGPSGP